jgi:hypothetical protein
VKVGISRNQPGDGIRGSGAGFQDILDRKRCNSADFLIRCGCPEAYGPPTTIYNRFVRWARRGIWENLFRELSGNGRYTDTQTIDSTHVKAHVRHRAEKGGSRSRLLAARAEGATRRSDCCWTSRTRHDHKS